MLFGLFSDLGMPENIFKADKLNPFIALGKRVTNKVRTILQDALQISGRCV